MKTVTVLDRRIGLDHPPFICAEMSANHNGSLERALALVEAAAEAGVHGLKLQTYRADTMTLDIDSGEFRIDEPDSLWKGYSLYRLYQQAYTPWEWHQQIFDRCKELGIVGFSTPFDITAVDFLESLDVPCYKIASFENIDLPLVRKIAATGKPIIMSTGMATIAELDETVRTIREVGNQDLILLKCTSNYPATPENSNLRTLPYLRQLFYVQVGLSDHTLGIGTAVASIALGSTFIEKHFTLSREAGGIDSAFSMEPQEMQQLVIESERAWQALGDIKFGPTEAEIPSVAYRRSLYIAQDMNAGEILTTENMKSIRPGLGLPPKYYETLLGQRLTKKVKRGTPLSWDLVFSKE